MYRPATGYTALYSCFNNWLHSVPTGYRLHSLVQLLQQLITVYRPATGYTALYSCFNNWLHSVPTGYRLHSLVQLFQQLVTECTNRVPATQPALNSLLCISRLQSLPAYYQPAPRITNPRSSTSWPLLISSLFTGLRLMTGLIMCSP